MKKILHLLTSVVLLAHLSMAQVAVPVYDQCANALNLNPVVGFNCTGTIVFHNILTNPTSQGSVPVPGCGSFIDGITNDVWFKFTAPIGILYQVKVDTYQVDPAEDLAMALYTGGCNGPWNLLTCDDNSNVSNMPLALALLASGTEVYIRLWSNTGTIPGNFKICVSLSNATAIAQNEFEAVNLFPNPFENTISFSSPLKNCMVRIIDTMGAVVNTIEQDQISEINTDHLKAGLYVVEISSGNISAKRKIVKL